MPHEDEMEVNSSKDGGNSKATEDMDADVPCLRAFYQSLCVTVRQLV